MRTLTLEIARTLRPGTTLHHKTLRNADGTPMRARVVGSPKIWKTRPDAIRIPAKHGLYESFQIGQGNTDRFCDQPLEVWDLD